MYEKGWTPSKSHITGVRKDAVEACGAVSVRAVIIRADILTVGVLTTLWSGILLITNNFGAINGTGPAAQWTRILQLDIKWEGPLAIAQGVGLLLALGALKQASYSFITLPKSAAICIGNMRQFIFHEDLYLWSVHGSMEQNTRSWSSLEPHYHHWGGSPGLGCM